MREFLSKCLLIRTGDYDERQLLARGRAWKAAFIALGVCITAEGLYVGVVDINVPGDVVFSAAVISLCAALSVFQGCCIFYDAYLELRRNVRSLILARVLCIAISLLFVWIYQSGLGLVTPLGIGAYNTVVLLALVAKLSVEKRKAGQEAVE